MKRLVIGTRGSALARWQAEHVAHRLRQASQGLEVELKIIRTKGDKILDVPLAKVGGKGLFVKEIEDALLRSEVDLAVHSIKDVPSELPEGLILTAVSQREDPRDALVLRSANSGGVSLARDATGGVAPPRRRAGLRSRHRSLPATPRLSLKPSPDLQTVELVSTAGDLSALPHGAVVGTSSLRRRCQLLHQRPDVKVLDLRGNVDTRLRKLDQGQYDAILLAAAGLKRLGQAHRICQTLEPETMVPAVGQGALGLETRLDDPEVRRLVTATLHHGPTATCVAAERALLAQLGGGCQVPVAGFARISGEILEIQAVLGHPSGQPLLREQDQGEISAPEALGEAVAERLLARGGREILDAVYG